MKVEIHPLKSIPLNKMQFAAIMARYQGKWIFVKHKDRKKWEFPGGRVEEDEVVFDTAGRELMEETGSIKFALLPVAMYTVNDKGSESYGMLFFADVDEFGELPEESEMVVQDLFKELPDDLTYPEITSALYDTTIKFLIEKGI